MVDVGTKKTLAKIPLLKTKAGPRDGELWVQRLKEEYQSLISVKYRYALTLNCITFVTNMVIFCWSLGIMTNSGLHLIRHLALLLLTLVLYYCAQFAKIPIICLSNSSNSFQSILVYIYTYSYCFLVIRVSPAQAKGSV